MDNNEKKIALVTGASRGIGRACAIALGKRQFVYDVLLNYLELELKEDNDAKRKRRIPRIHR